MKANINLSLLTASILLFAASCMAPKPLAGKFNQEQRKGRDTTSSVFVITQDGNKITGKKLIDKHNAEQQKEQEQQQAAAAADSSAAANAPMAKFASYQMVQTSKAFNVLYFPEQDDKNCDGVYISRLRFGKLSLYHYEQQVPLKYKYQKKRFYHEYVFQKADGKLQGVTYENFEDAISDDSTALNRFRELFPTCTIPKKQIEKTLSALLEVTELYNNANNDVYVQASR